MILKDELGLIWASEIKASYINFGLRFYDLIICRYLVSICISYTQVFVNLGEWKGFKTDDIGCAYLFHCSFIPIKQDR